MKRIWISSFLQDKQQVKGFDKVTVLVPYGEEYDGLKDDMKILGFEFLNIEIAGRDLMDCEYHFRKV